MNVSLTPELEEFVRRKVESGMYLSASEVVREALRLLDEQDKLRQVRRDELRRDIAAGIAQADQGELLDGAEVFGRLKDELRAK
jgi:antitoxin ParD1/3/4